MRTVQMGEGYIYDGYSSPPGQGMRVDCCRTCKAENHFASPVPEGLGMSRYVECWNGKIGRHVFKVEE